MARPQPPGRLGLLIAAAALVALPTLLWPRYVAARDSAASVARAMVAQTLPTAMVARTRAETYPTPWGWLVLLRGARVPCASTPWGCRLPATADSSPVFHDLAVCVEYGTARGYVIVGLAQPDGQPPSSLCAPRSPPS